MTKEEAIRKLQKQKAEYLEEWIDYSGVVEAFDMAIEALSAEPQIIRCKDCKYMTEHYDTDGNAPYWTCSEWDSGTDYDGFCHYAKKKKTMDDLISRQDAIDAISTWDKFGVDNRSQVVRWYEGLEPYVKLRDVVWAIENLPSAESLTDAEQRIFLKAISREEEICKLIDEEYKDEEYTLNLVNICNEIKRKVKGALWT